MSLNYREIELILSELSLENCLIQSVVQNDFHSLTWLLYSPKGGEKYYLYTEVGTPYSRINLTSANMVKNKTPKLQRFIQFCRANVEGSRIVNVQLKPGDREIKLSLVHREKTMFIFIRLFSGPGANIIVTDSQNKIMDLLLRRPNRNEMSGEIFVESLPKIEIPNFEIRARVPGLSFNEQIDQEYKSIVKEESLESLKQRLQAQYEKDVQRELQSISAIRQRIEQTKDWAEDQVIAELIAANSYLIKPKMSQIVLNDYHSGQDRVIELNPNIKPNEQIAYFYEKAKKAKRTHENAKETLETALVKLEKIKSYYEGLSAVTNIKELKTALAKVNTPTQNSKVETIGVSCTSNGWQITIGRTAKENDELLRHHFKGNDYWFHTRDCPGAYVFVKCPKTKTLPLEIMLDAANLAALYSKQKNSSKVSLYYTQVKHLRRAKNGPLGLVIPTQEKNLTIKVDRVRAQQLLGTKEFDYE